VFNITSILKPSAVVTDINMKTILKNNRIGKSNAKHLGLLILPWFCWVMHGSILSVRATTTNITMFSNRVPATVLRVQHSDEYSLAKVQDPNASDEEKVFLLRVAACKDQSAWGTALGELLQQANSERVKEMAMIRLRILTNWHGTVGVLSKYAVDQSANHRLRMLAVEGLRFHAEKAVTSILTELAASSEKTSLRAMALQSLRVVNPEAYNTSVDKIKTENPKVVALDEQLNAQGRPTDGDRARLPNDKEIALIGELTVSEGDVAFGVIQKLSKASGRQSVFALIDRFSKEGEKNKAEIMLTLAQIAKATPDLAGDVTQFLAKCREDENNPNLRGIAEECLLYLKKRAD
jgi:hypothetical protein